MSTNAAVQVLTSAREMAEAVIETRLGNTDAARRDREQILEALEVLARRGVR